MHPAMAAESDHEEACLGSSTREGSGRRDAVAGGVAAEVLTVSPEAGKNCWSTLSRSDSYMAAEVGHHTTLSPKRLSRPISDETGAVLDRVRSRFVRRSCVTRGDERGGCWRVVEEN